VDLGVARVDLEDLGILLNRALEVVLRQRLAGALGAPLDLVRAGLTRERGCRAERESKGCNESHGKHRKILSHRDPPRFRRHRKTCHEFHELHEFF